MPRILLVAGDPSGDHHAAMLAGALRERLPDARLHGYGGPALRAAGVDVRFDLPALSAIGLWDALPKVLPARAALRRLVAMVEAEPPDAAVLVDCGAFNLPTGRLLKARGVPVLGFFPPGSWSGSRKRAADVAAAYDAVATPFPNALPAYAELGLRAEMVGHPTVEALLSEHPAGAARLEPPTLALLPGSRAPEIRAMLPPMLGAAARLRQTLPGLRVRLSRAASAPAAMIDRLAARAGLDLEPADGGREALVGATAALVKSGTIALEAAALGIPQVVVYRASLAAYLVAGLYYWPRPRFWAMANVLTQAMVVPQVFQYRVTPANLARHLEPLLADTAERRAQIVGLRKAVEPLAGHGSVARAAELLVELLSRGSRAPA